MDRCDLSEWTADSRHRVGYIRSATIGAKTMLTDYDRDNIVWNERHLSTAHGGRVDHYTVIN